MNDTEPFFDFSNKTMAIIGMGLMGGSFAAALKDHFGAIIGVDPNKDSIKTAIAKGWIHEGYEGLNAALKKAQWIVLAAPVRTIINLLGEIIPFLQPAATIFDIGSVKTPIIQKMELLPREVNVLGGHPMCGKESSGIANADKDLFQGATFVLTPLSRTEPEVLSQGINIVKRIGAKPLLMSPQDHDQLVAYSSHLPYVIACSLANCVMNEAEENSDLLRLIASGFRDTTRLASSNLTMSLDILMSNRESVLTAIQAFRKELEYLEHCLVSCDEKRLFSFLSNAIEARTSLLTNIQK